MGLDPLTRLGRHPVRVARDPSPGPELACQWPGPSKRGLMGCAFFGSTMQHDGGGGGGGDDDAAGARGDDADSDLGRGVYAAR